MCPRNTNGNRNPENFPSASLRREAKGCSGREGVAGGGRGISKVAPRRELVAGLQNTVELEIWGTERIVGQEVGRWSEILEEVPKLPYLVHLGESSLLSSRICFGKGPGEVSAESESQSQLEKIKTQTKPDSLFWGHFHMH